MAYCTYEDVGTLLQLKYDESTSNPKASKVTDIIDMITAEVEMSLVGAGITIPTAGTNLYKVVKLKIMQGSAGVAGFTGYGNTEDVVGSQADYYKKEYMDFLLQLKKDPGFFKSLSNDLFVSNQVLDGTYTEKSISEVLIGNDWEA